MANAIYFGGANNILELHEGSQIEGVVSAIGKNNKLVLGGNKNSSFNVQLISPEHPLYQYKGFDQFEKTGGSTWTLTETTDQITPWTIKGGTLSIENDLALGAVEGILYLEGGTLQVREDIDTTRQIKLAGAGWFDVMAGKVLVLRQGITQVGAGHLIKKGEGVVKLQGINSYTGQTVVEGGKLQLEGSIVSTRVDVTAGATFDIAGMTGGSLTIKRAVSFGKIQLGDKNLTLTGGDTSLFVGEIAGSGGSLTKQGSGGLILAGKHTYTGKTDIEEGLLNLGTTAGDSYGLTELGSTLLHMQDGTTVELTGKVKIASGEMKFGDRTTFAISPTEEVGVTTALIAKSVDLTQGGTTFNLAGISDKSAANQVLIQTTDGIAGDFKTIAVGGFTGEVDYLTLQTNKSADDKDYLASYDLSWAANNNTMHGTFTLTNESDMFTVGAVLSDVANLHDNVANWGGKDLTKKGLGTLVLNAQNTYTGATEVQEGTLIVGDSVGHSSAQIAGHVNVANGATLGGHGTILGKVDLRDGSTLSPGYSVGTLTVGDIHFRSGSISMFEFNPDGTGDKVLAKAGLGAPLSTGVATIEAGAILDISSGGGGGTWGVNKYTLITAEGGVVGQFDTVRNNFAFLDAFLTKDFNNVYLQMVRNNVSFSAIGNTYNQRNTGQALQFMGTSNSLYQTILGMSAGQAQDAFDSLSGEIHASVKSATFTNSRYVRRAVSQHLDDGQLGNRLDTGKSLWVSPWYHNGHLKDDGNAAKLNNDGAGFLVGLDAYSSEKAAFGFALGYEQNDLDVGGVRNSKADTDAVHVVVYGRGNAGPVEIKGGLGYSWLDVDSKRTISVGNIYARNEANYSGNLLQMFVEGSHAFEYNGKDSISPFVRLAYQQIKFKDFTETGSALTQLHNNSQSDDITVMTLGARGHWVLGEKSSMYADLGWQRSFGSRAPKSTLNFFGGPRYSIKGVEMDRNAAVIGLGGSFQLKPNMSLSLGYEGLLGSQSRDHGAKILWETRF